MTIRSQNAYSMQLKLSVYIEIQAQNMDVAYLSLSTIAFFNPNSTQAIETLVRGDLEISNGCLRYITINKIPQIC